MNNIFSIELAGTKLPVRLKNMFAKFEKLQTVRAQNFVLLFDKDYVLLRRHCQVRYGEEYSDLKNVRYMGLPIRTYTE